MTTQIKKDKIRSQIIIFFLFVFFWWDRTDLNCGPDDYESSATNRLSYDP